LLDTYYDERAPIAKRNIEWSTENAHYQALKNYRVAIDGDLIDPENVWHKLYEVTPTGAVLVRPDGHVAWRSKSMVDSPINTLRLLIQV
jgi:hypothetical protein